MPKGRRLLQNSFCWRVGNDQVFFGLHLFPLPAYKIVLAGAIYDFLKNVLSFF
jgi:hypothetical protein